MKNYTHLILLCVLICFFSCSEKGGDSQKVNSSEVKLPAVLEKGLTAHGGLDKWNSMKSLTYSFDKNGSKETQKTSLRDRKCFYQQSDPFASWGTSEDVGSGTISITENNDNYIEGTFSFTGVNLVDNTTKEFTAGRFKAKKI